MNARAPVWGSLSAAQVVHLNLDHTHHPKSWTSRLLPPGSQVEPSYLPHVSPNFSVTLGPSSFSSAPLTFSYSIGPFTESQDRDGVSISGRGIDDPARQTS